MGALDGPKDKEERQLFPTLVIRNSHRWPVGAVATCRRKESRYYHQKIWNWFTFKRAIHAVRLNCIRPELSKQFAIDMYSRIRIVIRLWCGYLLKLCPCLTFCEGHCTLHWENFHHHVGQSHSPMQLPFMHPDNHLVKQAPTQNRFNGL